MPQAPIQLLPIQFDVGPLQAFLEHCPYWDFRKDRTDSDRSPHREVSDIWCRYGDWSDPKVRENASPFPMRWYFHDLQALLEPIVEPLMEYIGGDSLGLVLITKIAPSGQVYPHIDHGWHSETFSKYCVCIKADHQQCFGFKDHELKTRDGEVFWFDNKQEHHVLNNSSRERISAIICIKTPRGIHSP